MRRLLLALPLTLALGACGSSHHASTATSSAAPSTTASTGSTSTGTQVACQRVPAPAPHSQGHLAAPHLKLDPSKTYTVTMATNCGTIAFTLDVKRAPKTSASIYYLVKQGFFNGLTFHRVVPGFVIQGGDPTGTGGGGPGYTVVEPPAANTQYVLGDVAMAKTQTEAPGTSGSQFFIVTAANATQQAGLTPDYAIVGKVVSGLDVVLAIGRVVTNPAGDGAPVRPVVISRATVSAS